MNEARMEGAQDMINEACSENWPEYAIDNGWVDPTELTPKDMFNLIKNDYDALTELFELIHDEFSRQDAMFDAQIEYSKENENP